VCLCQACVGSSGRAEGRQPYKDTVPLTAPRTRLRSVPTGLNPATVIGRHVTIGAGSLLRSVVVEDEVAIGQRCVLMEGAVVESGAVLADGTVVPPGRRIPGKQLWAGSPARYVRDVSYDEAHEITHLAKSIGSLADAHGDQLLPEQDMNAFKDAAALKAALTGSS
jgi:carbonic anhydrase/acetyltransferase-like protein (isoleucine patch superfamily)